jgi:uncharacterized membrane protein YidH (DUF202 family)
MSEIGLTLSLLSICISIYTVWRRYRHDRVMNMYYARKRYHDQLERK